MGQKIRQNIKLDIQTKCEYDFYDLIYGICDSLNDKEREFFVCELLDSLDAKKVIKKLIKNYGLELDSIG